MPSVGLRRTTRIFGMFKAADGARVLRSGRHIYINSGESKVKHVRNVNDMDLDRLVKGHGKRKGTRSRTANKPCNPKAIPHEHIVVDDDFRVKRWKKSKTEAVDDEKPADKIFGIVYTRKRKRYSVRASDSPDEADDTLRSLKFYCRRSRVSDQVLSCRPLLSLVVDWSCEQCWFSSVFGLVMRYMKRETLRLSDLTVFFLSQPVNNVYADHGVRFFLEPPINQKGICKFFGSVNSLPLFSADFASAPPCFKDMHATLFLRVMNRSLIFVEKSIYLLENGESDTDAEEVILESSNSRKERVLGSRSTMRTSKSTGGFGQCRGSLGSHSFQKRSSFRRSSRNIPYRTHKSDPSTASSRKLRSSMINNSTHTKQELDCLSCCANMLVIGSDRCKRERGFDVMLECSSSKEWFLVVKKEGSIIYSHKAQKMMRPCSCNRFRHSIVWAGDHNWKLEFCDRQNWSFFKDLYKECYERNVLEPAIRVIPIPGVREIHESIEEIDEQFVFSRPVSYISVKEDEVSRAMARTSAIYDMDSEDEEWLRGYKGEQLQKDTFEMMIDGYEKACFRSSIDELLDEKAESCDLSHLARQEVVEAVYGYWARKRKQRKAPLIQVFESHRAKKTTTISKSSLRKRRSFKKQTSRQLHAKVKQLSPLHVKVSKQNDGSEEHKALIRAEEAKVSAETSMEIAITKRQRAQILAEKADLAAYKAMMTLRIAEAVRVAESSEAATTLLLN